MLRLSTALTSISFLLLLSFVVLSCRIEEIPPPDPDIRPASSPVINEVFTLPLTHPNTFWWIEVYNPTTQSFDLTNWTVSLTTVRFDRFRLLAGSIDTTVLRDSVTRKDTLGNIFPLADSIRTVSGTSLSRLFEEDIFAEIDTGVFDVPFAEGLYAPQLYGIFDETVVPVVLQPEDLFTIVNNQNRLEEYTEWGPGDTRLRRERFFLQGAVDSTSTLGQFAHDTSYSTGQKVFRDTAFSVSDTVFTIIDTLRIFRIRDTVQFRAKAYAFLIHPKDQLILKDSSGQIIDVVRIGDSVYVDQSNISPLLGYPSNSPVPTPPEFESVARFARGYFTGNTANDFYITRRPFIVPIPHGGSTLFKGQ